jgi:hypothetical protein
MSRLLDHYHNAAALLGLLSRKGWLVSLGVGWPLTQEISLYTPKAERFALELAHECSSVPPLHSLLR